MKRFDLDNVSRALIIATATAWSMGVAAQGAQPAQPSQPSQPAQPGTPSAQQPGTAVSPAMQAAFKRADADGDGKISRDEAAKAGMAADKFGALDKNGDGMLDIVEFSSPVK
jgi:EF hand